MKRDSSLLSFLALLLGACASRAAASDPAPLASAPEEASAPAPAAAEHRLTLVARWAPIASSKYHLEKESKELAVLLAAGPALPEEAWSASAFAFLLPPEGTAAGAAWRLVAAPFLPFLRQFHPGATLTLHHGYGSQVGAVATLLSESPTRFDVLFRLHAEIEAIPGALYYTPAQFEGRLVWDRLTREVLHFQLAVPPRDTNVDVNARIREDMIAADIGFVPEMSLRLADTAFSPGETDLEPARQALERAIYGGFTEIEWMPLAQAAHRARAEERPLHVLILFGALDDESC